MKNIIKASAILLLLIFAACETSEFNKPLLGTWTSIDTDYTPIQLQFYKDSLVLTGLAGDFHSNSQWNADAANIYLKNVKVKNAVSKKGSTTTDEITYRYTLSANHDTLEMKVLNDAPIKIFRLVKMKPGKE